MVKVRIGKFMSGHGADWWPHFMSSVWWDGKNIVCRPAICAFGYWMYVGRPSIIGPRSINALSEKLKSDGVLE